MPSFVTTRWSLILAAGERSQPALAELCRIYWQPVYAFLCGLCRDRDKARDLTQSFFANLLEKETFSRADPERGRFRSFLLKSAHHFFLSEVDRERSQKRGGGRPDAELDDPAFGLQPAHSLTPETLFAREWVVTILKRALHRLKNELSPEQRIRFRQLEGTLTEAVPGPGYPDLARQLGLSETALRVTIHRFRKRFRQCVRQEVSDTVGSPDLVDDEIRFLLDSFGAGG